jgi:hypothetical protein
MFSGYLREDAVHVPLPQKYRKTHAGKVICHVEQIYPEAVEHKAERLSVSAFTH